MAVPAVAKDFTGLRYIAQLFGEVEQCQLVFDNFVLSSHVLNLDVDVLNVVIQN